MLGLLDVSISPVGRVSSSSSQGDSSSSASKLLENGDSVAGSLVSGSSSLEVGGDLRDVSTSLGFCLASSSVESEGDWVSLEEEDLSAEDWD